MRVAKIGIIGTGHISEIYCENLTNVHANTEIVAVADVIREVAEKKAAKWNIPYVLTVEELLAREDIDIVVNLTPPKNHYEVIKAGTGEQEADIWDFVTLGDCKAIATSGSHWTDIFEKNITRPEEEKLVGGKDAKTEWLTRVEAIDNKLQKNTQYSVSAQDFEFLKEIRAWLAKE